MAIVRTTSPSVVQIETPDGLGSGGDIVLAIIGFAIASDRVRGVISRPTDPGA